MQVHEVDLVSGEVAGRTRADLPTLDDNGFIVAGWYVSFTHSFITHLCYHLCSHLFDILLTYENAMNDYCTGWC